MSLLAKLVRIRLRRGTTEKWADADPVLDPGEPGWDSSTGHLRIGDGVQPWSDLTRVGEDLAAEAVQSHVDAPVAHEASQVGYDGAAGGATVDEALDELKASKRDLDDMPTLHELLTPGDRFQVFEDFMLREDSSTPLGWSTNTSGNGEISYVANHPGGVFRLASDGEGLASIRMPGRIRTRESWTYQARVKLPAEASSEAAEWIAYFGVGMVTTSGFVLLTFGGGDNEVSLVVNDDDGLDITTFEEVDVPLGEWVEITVHRTGSQLWSFINGDALGVTSASWESGTHRQPSAMLTVEDGAGERQVDVDWISIDQERFED